MTIRPKLIRKLSNKDVHSPIYRDKYKVTKYMTDFTLFHTS